MARITSGSLRRENRSTGCGSGSQAFRCKGEVLSFSAANNVLSFGWISDKDGDDLLVDWQFSRLRSDN